MANMKVVTCRQQLPKGWRGLYIRRTAAKGANTNGEPGFEIDIDHELTAKACQRRSLKPLKKWRRSSRPRGLDVAGALFSLIALP